MLSPILLPQISLLQTCNHLYYYHSVPCYKHVLAYTTTTTVFPATNNLSPTLLPQIFLLQTCYHLHYYHRFPCYKHVLTYTANTVFPATMVRFLTQCFLLRVAKYACLTEHSLVLLWRGALNFIRSTVITTRFYLGAQRRDRITIFAFTKQLILVQI